MISEDLHLPRMARQTSKSSIFMPKLVHEEHRAAHGRGWAIVHKEFLILIIPEDQRTGDL